MFEVNAAYLKLHSDYFLFTLFYFSEVFSFLFFKAIYLLLLFLLGFISASYRFTDGNLEIKTSKGKGTNVMKLL